MRGITTKHEKRAVVQITIRTATHRAHTNDTLSCAHSPESRWGVGGGRKRNPRHHRVISFRLLLRRRILLLRFLFAVVEQQLKLTCTQQHCPVRTFGAEA